MFYVDQLFSTKWTYTCVCVSLCVQVNRTDLRWWWWQRKTNQPPPPALINRYRGRWKTNRGAYCSMRVESALPSTTRVIELGQQHNINASLTPRIFASALISARRWYRHHNGSNTASASAFVCHRNIMRHTTHRDSDSTDCGLFRTTAVEKCLHKNRFDMLGGFVNGLWTSFNLDMLERAISWMYQTQIVWHNLRCFVIKDRPVVRIYLCGPQCETNL